MTLIDGRPLAAAIREQTATEVGQLIAAGVLPTLVAVVPSADPATEWYLGSIARAAGQIGITMREARLQDGGSPGLVELIEELSGGPAHGIICLTPLPDGLTFAEVAAHIPARLDVDGANPLSLGRLAAGLPAFAPATAQAVIELLRHEQVALSGAEVVVVGRSTVVGKPLALLLLAENATVTVCHSRTRDLAAVTRRADVLVAAAGQAHLIGAEHVKEGAVVIDVGTNATDDGGLLGDVDTVAVEQVAAAVTPVPGGVGPVTTAVLLRNVLSAARSAGGAPGG
jgi:methylenetetrahydrofolate dehydrogenase (NADP+)/methenyltetrahydrofolate cyclohydrolase